MPAAKFGFRGSLKTPNIFLRPFTPPSQPTPADWEAGRIWERSRFPKNEPETKQPLNEVKLTVSSIVTTNQSSLAGTLAPSIEATPLDAEEPFSLENQFGKVVAIEFWATWCGPCIAVMPEMQKMYEEHKDNPDFVMISVNMDDDEESVREMIEAQGIEYPVIFEGKGWQSEIGRALGVTNIPASFVIGRDGTFAGDSMHGNKLPAAVAKALESKTDAGQPSGPPWKLAITAKLDTEQRDTAKLNTANPDAAKDIKDGDNESPGVPGLVIDLQAFDVDGNQVAQTKIAPRGTTKKAAWRYPALPEGGRLEVTASMAGGEPISRTINQPAADEAIELSFPATCRLDVELVDWKATDDSSTLPAAAVPNGCEVTASDSRSGFSKKAFADESGIVTLNLPPGTYRLTLAPTENWVETGLIEDEDPPRGREQSLAWRTGTIDLTGGETKTVRMPVCQPITVRGTVIAMDGEPAVNAKIGHEKMPEPRLTSMRDIDRDGKFELTGVPSIGITQFYGRGDEALGEMAGYANQGFDPDKHSADNFKVQLATEDEQYAARLPGGATVPPLSVVDLQTGETVDLAETNLGKRLVVFMQTWHPAHRESLSQIEQWSIDRDTPVHVIALDAAPQFQELGGNHYHASQGAIGLHERWKIAHKMEVYLLDGGRVRGTPEKLRAAIANP